jgi:predicted benzoate:H+ symporter BenE
MRFVGCILYLILVFPVAWGLFHAALALVGTVGLRVQRALTRVPF